MIYIRTGAIHDFVTLRYQPPAHIYLFGVHEKKFVHPIYLPVRFSSYHAACTAWPKNLCAGVILAIVFLCCIKNSSTAKGVSQKINHTPRRAPMLELFMV